MEANSEIDTLLVDEAAKEEKKRLRYQKLSEKMRGRKMSDFDREMMAKAKRGRRGQDTNNYKRGRFLVGRSGFQYWVVSDGSVKRYEHRMIAESSLGREISKNEHVHHVNGDRLDNDPKNLIILKNGAHMRLHRFCFPATKEEQLAWLSSQNEWFFEVSSEN